MQTAQITTARTPRRVAALALLLATVAAPAAGQDDAKRDSDADSPRAKAQEKTPNVVAGQRPKVRLTYDPKAGVEIAPKEMRHDFGRVRQGVDLTHRFLMRSTGASPLRISHASPSCGCLVGEIKVRPEGAEEFTAYELGAPIEKGTEVALDSEVQTIAKQDRTKITISVFTNASKGPLQLALELDVAPFLRATPPSLGIGEIPFRTGASRKVTVTTTYGERVMLFVDDSRPARMPEGFSFDLSAVRPDAEGKSNQWIVDVRVAPDAPEGPGGYAIRLVSDAPFPRTPALERRLATLKARGKSLGPMGEFYNVSVLVNYNVLGELSVSPRSIPLGVIPRGGSAQRSVTLVAADPDFDLSKATFELRGPGGAELPLAEHFTHTVREVPGRNALEITVKASNMPAIATGQFRGELLIRTGHPRKPEIVVIFAGGVRG